MSVRSVVTLEEFMLESSQRYGQSGWLGLRTNAYPYANGSKML